MRPMTWTLAAGLLTSFAGLAWAQPMTKGGRPVGAPHPSELFNSWFGQGKAKETRAKSNGKARPEARSKTTAARPAEVQAAEKPAEKSPTEKIAERLEREQRAFLRRVAVCDRLRQIALQSNDDALFKKADQLQEQAWSLCLERTGMVPVDGAASPVDEDILDQKLGAESRNTRIDRLYTVPGRGDDRQLALEEDQRPTKEGER